MDCSALHIHPLLQDILGDNSEVPIRVRNWYKRVADTYLKPLLLRSDVREGDKMMETFEVLQTQDAMLLVKGKSLKIPDITLGQDNMGFTQVGRVVREASVVRS